MNVLKTVRDIELNEGNSSASGLFNVSDENDVSFWFDTETKERLLNLSDADFWHQSKQMIKESNID